MTLPKTEDRAARRLSWHWSLLLAASIGVLVLLPVSSEILWGNTSLVGAGGLTAAVVTALLLPAIRVGPARCARWLGRIRRRLHRPHR